MIKYFSLVLELMNIEAHEKYLEVAQYIEQHPSMILSLCHPYGFIFAAFSDLVQGKIFEDQFVALGDTYSHSPLQNYAVSCDPSLFLESLEYGIEQHPKMYQNTLFIVQSSQKTNLLDIDQKLSLLQSKLFVL